MAMTSISTLTDHGQSDLRRQALELAEVGLAAADGGRAVHETVRLRDGGIEIAGSFHPLPPGRKLFVLGGGKATLPVAQALEEVLGERIDAGVIVLRQGESAATRRLEVLHADHPLPSGASVRAANRVVELAAQAEAGDLVVTCFTGGRSALLSMPPPQVSFEDKLRLNQLLVGSGMPIAEINTVRKHVSLIKGGRLAEQIAPARIVNLTVSDVAGDTLDVLADLTTQDTSTPADAVEVLRRHGLFDQIPESVRSHLASEAANSPALDDLAVETVMLVDGQRVCKAIAAHARVSGLEPEIVSTTLEGEAGEIGRYLARLATTDKSARVLLGCGGEATVRVADTAFGRGGPNQEAAIAAALVLDGHQAAIAFLDTDGSDGGTDAAGAICDGETAERARELDLDLGTALTSHSATEPLRALDDLIVTGPTGTNVNDLFVAVTRPPEKEAT